MSERVTHTELLGFRRELLESIPLALRERLNDIDHLLGWPPVAGEVDRLKAVETAAADYVKSCLCNGGTDVPELNAMVAGYQLIRKDWVVSFEPAPPIDVGSWKFESDEETP